MKKEKFKNQDMEINHDMEGLVWNPAENIVENQGIKNQYEGGVRIFKKEEKETQRPTKHIVKPAVQEIYIQSGIKNMRLHTSLKSVIPN